MNDHEQQRSRRDRLCLLLHTVLPVTWVVGAGSRALGGIEVDLVGHIWTIWHAMHEPLTRTELIGYPDGIDLMPILGGWADIW